MHAPNEKDAVTGRKYDVLPGDCTVGPAGQYAHIQGDFFNHMVGQSAPTRLAIVHWIGCINAIKCTVSSLGDL